MLVEQTRTICEKLKEQYSSDEMNNEMQKAEEAYMTRLLLLVSNITAKRKLYADQLLSDALEDLIRKYED